MSRGGGKGRVSNELVAASCAAILAVYAAGYWRTRDEARRFETASQARRPARSTPVPVEAPTPTRHEVSATPAAAAVPPAAPVASEPRSTLAKSPKVEAAPPPPVAAASGDPLVEQQPLPQPEPAVAVAAPAPEPPAEVTWRDGIYTGWGRSFHGDIEARVTIRDGRIRASEIATCATRYPCYVIDSILNQPVDRQSPDVDRVSRATESADAYSDAVWQALQKAEAEPDAAPVASP